MPRSAGCGWRKYSTTDGSEMTESTDKAALGLAYDKYEFWKALLVYEAGAWVLLAFASLGFGATAWRLHYTWIAGMEHGSFIFALTGIHLIVLGAFIRRRRDCARRAYMRAKHGPGSEW